MKEPYKDVQASPSFIWYDEPYTSFLAYFNFKVFMFSTN
jgi:hypothetical protein